MTHFSEVPNEAQRPPKEQPRRGEFFALDQATWAQIATPEVGLNPAVAYLILAGFSRPSTVGRVTSASVNAIERYTNISRGRARQAIDVLDKRGFIKRVSSADAKPRYEMPRLEVGAATDSDAIWLPNTVVTGAGQEVSPVELLRQTQDVLTLRLITDLYAQQDLAEDAGIDRRVLRWDYERHLVGEHGEYSIWGFRQTNVTHASLGKALRHHWREPTKEEKAAGKNGYQDFFRRLDVLESIHLFEWVPMLFESSAPTAEPLFACRGCSGAGEDRAIEHRIAVAAWNASAAMLTPAQMGWALKAGFTFLVPMKRHYAAVEMTGIARLRYRPRTRRTGAWFAELRKNGGRVAEMFELLASPARKAAPVASPAARAEAAQGTGTC